jgi:hypothetical protein
MSLSLAPSHSSGINQGLFSDSQHKEFSKIMTKISHQKNVIEKERAIITERGDTYICQRARTSLAGYKKKLESADADFKRKLEALEREHLENIEKYKVAIEHHQSVIDNETTKKTTPTIIRAEKEIEILKRELERFKNPPSKEENLPSKEEEDEDFAAAKAEFFRDMPQYYKNPKAPQPQPPAPPSSEPTIPSPPLPSKKPVKGCGAPRPPQKEMGVGVVLYGTPQVE